jgi:uncharacterized membrane protein YphA (DoxX/SURF4 family)
VGLRTNWAALLAAYVLIATSLYHTNFSQAVQGDLFAKDVAIVGGLELVAAFEAGRISLDALLGNSAAACESIKREPIRTGMTSPRRGDRRL